jgi:hypothetical protein
MALVTIGTVERRLSASSSAGASVLAGIAEKIRKDDNDRLEVRSRNVKTE